MEQYSSSTGHILLLNSDKVNFFSKHRSIGFVQAICWIALLSKLRTDILREPKYNRITRFLTISQFTSERFCSLESFSDMSLELPLLSFRFKGFAIAGGTDQANKHRAVL